MLRKRLIGAVGFIVPLLLLFWFDATMGRPGIVLGPVCFVAGLLIANEVVCLLRQRTPGATAWVVYVGTALVIIAAALPNLIPSLPADCPVGRWGWVCLALVFTLLCALGVEMIKFKEGENRSPIVRVALTMFAVLYAGWLLSFLLALRLFMINPDSGPIESRWGALAAFSVLFIVKMSDAGAYFVGKRFGKRKLARQLSPGKTIEGLVGGILFAVAASVIFFYWLVPTVVDVAAPKLWAYALYAASLTAAGVFGDLCESLVKRDMGKKDSSGWLPGLGGILDTADSVLVAAPVAFFWWTTRLLGP